MILKKLSNCDKITIFSKNTILHVFSPKNDLKTKKRNIYGSFMFDKQRETAHWNKARWKFDGRFLHSFKIYAALRIMVKGGFFHLFR